jgi:hypothetical protein
MDTISYAYADEAHSRIDTLENIVTRYGDEITLTGDVLGYALVSGDGSVTIQTVLSESAGGESFLQAFATGSGFGYRLKNVDYDNYGIVGTNAFDLSYSYDINSSNGALGDYSFAIGEGTQAHNNHQLSIGRYNLQQTETVFEIGVGIDNDTRSNAVEVYNDGRIKAPHLTTDKIDSEKSLVTKEYVDAKTVQDLVGLLTIEKTLIQNNEITLPDIALGDIAFGYAHIFENLTENIFFEVTCQLSEDKTKVLFDEEDMLNDKYCVLSYLTYKQS